MAGVLFRFFYSCRFLTALTPFLGGTILKVRNVRENPVRF